FADTGASIPVGEAPATAKAVCRATQTALQAGIQVARHGNRLSDLQRVIGQTARRAGFSVIQNLSGHGIGRHLHEAPRHVPDNSRQDRRPFQRGMVLTLEPFLSTGATHAQEAGDGWTLVTRPGHWTAQFEHTIIVTDGKPIIVTQQ
nr:M24 family metallopeptidase [Caldilineaceae bacterium]